MPSRTIERAELLTRGRLAKRVGCNLETIRYYEQIGLLPLPPRGSGGQRLYGPDLLKRLHFIRRCRELGFTIEEIRGLLRLVGGGNYTCAQVEGLALEHTREIRRKIADLTRLRKTFETMIAQCSGGEVPDCPIIDVLFEARDRPVTRESLAHSC